ncbi:MAG TPA: SDR family NAD(P)-dependent oxidoreductase, partial [Leptospiraceae bacterium]|nr:SDR family NAD(P)-dependent oxidoreductase [Leptospiraceae bacterium]
NHLAHFLLTMRLLDFLKKNSGFRIVNLSSVAHRNGVFDPENLQAEKNFTGYGAYALSKLANILFTMELSEKIKGKGTSNCMHPGVIGTKLLKTGFNMSGGTLDEGSDNSVYLSVSPEVQEITGKYFVKREVSPVNPKLIPKEHRKQLWEISEKMTSEFL